mmetsp:Transcript_4909/g.16480  ORF Transcript_4909/g.16480 Transcript_4909/m.16480 type:complete len:697 (-) Transcript_4909:92-2182(-)
MDAHAMRHATGTYGATPPSEARTAHARADEETSNSTRFDGWWTTPRGGARRRAVVAIGGVSAVAALALFGAHEGGYPRGGWLGTETTTTRARARGAWSAPSAGFTPPFELPEDLHAAIAALGDEPTMGIEANVDSYKGVEELEGGGYVVEVEGGLNATLRRLQTYMLLNRQKDAENERCEAEKEYMGQAAYDEGATSPLKVNASEYAGKLSAEIAQDKTVAAEHEHILQARAAARLGKNNAGTNFAGVVSGTSAVNTEVSNSKVINTEYCWKDSYGRGVGVTPSHCPSHKETLAGGIICYDKCHNFGSNWYRFGYDCHQSCNSGWDDHGLLCHKANWGRGVGEARCEWQEWWAAADLGESRSTQPTHQRKLLGGVVHAVVQAVRKTKLVCGGSLCSRVGKQDCLGLCYPPCPSSNPNWIGCNLCGASCSSYAGGIAPSCMKGVKVSPGMEWATCPPGWDFDAGLCYQPCRKGFTGVGPVCWGDAPIVNGKKWVHCGMGAASDSAACATATTDQILGPLEIVAFAATAGTSSTATAAAKASKKAGLKNAATQLKKHAKDVAKDPQSGPSFINACDDLINAESDTDKARAAMALISIADPTGVTSTISAYTYDTCDKIQDTSSTVFVRPTDWASCNMAVDWWWSGNACYEACYNTQTQCGNHVGRNGDGSCAYQSRVCARPNHQCVGQGANKAFVSTC